MPYVTRAEWEMIKDAAKASTFKNAHFGGFRKDADAYSDEIREVTRVYRDSWITEPLADVIREVETRESRK